MSVTFPELNVEILADIVRDAAGLCSEVKAVGLTGSFARGDHSRISDVDLIVRYDKAVDFQKILENFGEYVRHVLDYQFNKRLDIVRYDLALECADRDPDENEVWYWRGGFEKMLNEVKWLYER